MSATCTAVRRQVTGSFVAANAVTDEANTALIKNSLFIEFSLVGFELDQRIVVSLPAAQS